jgi:hypothetical protein
VSTPFTLINEMLEFLARAMTQKREIKRIRIEKDEDEVKLTNKNQ